MPFGQTGGTTITATMGLNTQPMQQSLNQLPQHVRQALNQATQHTTSFSESFGKLFSRGDTGERRFHSLIGSVIRDMSQAQGGAEGAATAMASFFERISAGTGAGAVLVAVGVGLERLVSKGEELRKTGSEITKESQQMEHALKLSTAAEGYSALATKAHDFHKQQRKDHDEAAKDQEHMIRLVARRIEDEFRHPFSSRKAREERVSDEGGKAARAEAKAKEAVRKEDELALTALERGAQLAKVRLQGSEQEAEMVKLATEYEQRRNEIIVMSKRSGHGTEAMAALNEEFALRQRLIQAQAAAAEREFNAQMRQAGLSRQTAADQNKLADIQISALSTEEKALAVARERGDLAVDRIESAKAEVEAAQDELEASKSLSLEEQRRAQLRLQNAQTAEAEARTAAKGAAAGVADERAKAIQQGAAERRMTPDEQRKQYQERTKEWESTVQELAHRGIRGDLAEPPKMGQAEYDPLRKFKAAAAQEELARQQQQEKQPLKPQTAEEAKKSLEQDERKNPVLTLIKGDVSEIVALMKAAKKADDKPPTPKQPGPQAPTGPQPTPTGAGGGQGQQPPGAPASPVGKNDGLPKGWKQDHVPGEQPFDPATGQWIPQPSEPQPTGVQGAQGEPISADTLTSQGIDPTQSMANVDKGALSNIEKNKQDFDKYWKDRRASGADLPRPAGGEARTDKGGEWQPMGDYGPQAQPPQPEQPPAAKPSPLPSPPEGADKGGTGMVQAIKEAISSVMDKYWR